MVKKGVDDAAALTGATVNYSAPATFDMVQMSQLIDAAVAKGPDGLVVSVPDYDALQDSLAAATDAGIPIITINSGSDVYQEIGALTHVGQDETVAGEGAGAKLAEEGATKVICINQEVGNAALDARCAGAKEAIEEAGGTLEVLQVDLNDAAGAQNTISSALQADPDIDGILALGPTGAAPALAAKQDIGSDAMLATFDLSPEVLDAIEAGDMAFAVDQQQYLQGYLPIVFLTLYAQQPEHRRRWPAGAHRARASSRRRTPPRSRTSRPPGHADLIHRGGGRSGPRHQHHSDWGYHDGSTDMATVTAPVGLDRPTSASAARRCSSGCSSGPSSAPSPGPSSCGSCSPPRPAASG